MTEVKPKQYRFYQVLPILGNNHPKEVKPYDYMGNVLVRLPLNNHYLTPDKPISLQVEGEAKPRVCRVYSWTLSHSKDKPEVVLYWENN